MIKKSFNLLKNNSVIIMFYAAYLVAVYLIVFALYPKDMSQFMNTDPAAFDFIAYIVVVVKMLIASLLMCILGLLFFSGFGSLLAEVTITSKTSANSFFTGLKKYFVRVLLMGLLLFAFIIGFSIVLSIIIVPITIFLFINGSISNMSIIITSITGGIIILSAPFIILWLPAIFIEDIGVMHGLKNGAKAGVKNYWKLLLIILMIYLPVMVNVLINMDTMTSGVIYNPSYFVMCILTSIITLVAFPIIFLIYKENKQTYVIK